MVQRQLDYMRSLAVEWAELDDKVSPDVREKAQRGPFHARAGGAAEQLFAGLPFRLVSPRVDQATAHDDARKPPRHLGNRLKRLCSRMRR